MLHPTLPTTLEYFVMLMLIIMVCIAAITALSFRP